MQLNAKPIYSMEVSSYTHPIILYHHDHHFDGIRTNSKFMDARYYCQHCEAPYSHPKSNFMRCNAGCVNCSGLGVGFPCENIRAQGIFCSNCKKTFYNDSYYQRHLSNKVCNQFTKCLDCGVIWNHDTHKKKAVMGMNVAK